MAVTEDLYRLVRITFALFAGPGGQWAQVVSWDPDARGRQLGILAKGAGCTPGQAEMFLEGAVEPAMGQALALMEGVLRLAAQNAPADAGVPR